MSDFRRNCIEQKLLVGTFAAIPHPVAIEVTAAAGVDFLCIDWEHSQVETAEGLTNIAEIAAVDGVDLIFIGPGDLSVSIDAMGPTGKDRLDTAIKSITRAALSAGRAVGIFRPSADDVGAWSEDGISFFMLASDTMFLGASLAAGVNAARAGLHGGEKT